MAQHGRAAHEVRWTSVLRMTEEGASFPRPFGTKKIKNYREKSKNGVWLSLVERYVRDVALDAHFTTS